MFRSENCSFIPFEQENLIIIISTIIVYLLCGRNCAYMIFSDPHISLGRQAPYWIQFWNEETKAQRVNKLPKTLWQVESKPDSHSTVLKQCKIIQGDQITFHCRLCKAVDYLEFWVLEIYFPLEGTVSNVEAWFNRHLMDEAATGEHAKVGDKRIQECVLLVFCLAGVGRNDFFQMWNKISKYKPLNHFVLNWNFIFLPLERFCFKTLVRGKTIYWIKFKKIHITETINASRPLLIEGPSDGCWILRIWIETKPRAKY